MPYVNTWSQTWQLTFSLQDKLLVIYIAAWNQANVTTMGRFSPAFSCWQKFIHRKWPYKQQHIVAICFNFYCKNTTHRHTHTDTDRHTHTHTHTDRQTDTHTHSHTCTHTHTHTHTYARTHAHAHTHTRTSTHTHTHTLTKLCKLYTFKDWYTHTNWLSKFFQLLMQLLQIKFTFTPLPIMFNYSYCTHYIKLH